VVEIPPFFKTKYLNLETKKIDKLH
jgi:hypothetical protein